jgi:hypothetical protein
MIWRFPIERVTNGSENQGQVRSVAFVILDLL